jgi:hypothetical protein
MSQNRDPLEALYDDPAVVRAMEVLEKHAITGEQYEKLVAMTTTQKISYTIHQDDGTGHCATCGTEWPAGCAVEKNAVYVAEVGWDRR